MLDGGGTLDHKIVPFVGDHGKFEPGSALELAADEARVQPFRNAHPNPPLAPPIFGDFPHDFILKTVGDLTQDLLPITELSPVVN